MGQLSMGEVFLVQFYPRGPATAAAIPLSHDAYPDIAHVYLIRVSLSPETFMIPQGKVLTVFIAVPPELTEAPSTN